MLFQELSDIVSRTMGHLRKEDIGKIVDHLISSDVGVTSVSDLKDMTLQYLPPSIPPLKRNQLLASLKAAGNQAAGPQATGAGAIDTAASTQGREGSGGSLNIGVCSAVAGPSRVLEDTENFSSKPFFKFEVPWNSMPALTMTALLAAHKAGTMADPKELNIFKRAICKKLVSQYKVFRERNPGSFKHPGRAVYTDITNQVFAKLRGCLVVRVNNRTIGDGKAAFNRLLEVSTDNMMRKYYAKGDSRSVQARKGKGTVGVLAEQYQPILTDKSEEEQSAIKVELFEIYEGGPENWNWHEIELKMKASFDLQRKDIVNAKNLVDQDLEKENDNNREDIDDLPGKTALQTLKDEWPFLFKARIEKFHHQQLTGRDLHAEMASFCEEKLEFLYMFMTTCSNANIENLALRLKLEQDEILDNDAKVLACLVMTANHFGEDHTSLLFTAEETLLPSELDLDIGSICIIGLGQHAVKAKTFHVCADKTPLIECKRGAEALTCMFEICFDFDLQYPSLPLTIEFFERYVFGMGFEATRVANKRGKFLVTLTDAVNKLVNELEKFNEKLRTASTT